MMRAAVALLVSVSMLGCFPHNAKHRQYAKIAEGGALVGGIVISAVGNTGADCDEMMMRGQTDCRDKAQLLSTIGMTLILGGLIGFIATVSTAEDDEAKPVVTSIPDQPKPETKQPAPPKPAPEGAGSAAPGTVAPQL